MCAGGLQGGYGGKSFVGPVDLEAGSGDVTVLIGPNGSGKSTLIKTFCGLIPPVSGSLSLVGANIAQLSPQQVAQRVASVPQDEAYSFDFTVRQVAAMGRLAKSQSFFESEEDLAATERALTATDCADLADRPISELSGGERQRVLIARAIAQETDLILLDEPTAHLDIQHIRQFCDLAANLSSMGKGIVLATHDLNLAISLAHRIVLLDKGKPVFAGTPEEFVSGDYAENTYQASFVRVASGKRTLMTATYR